MFSWHWQINPMYALPKKIEMTPSQAKWQIQSAKSVMVFLGLDELKQQFQLDNSEIQRNLIVLSQKAKALDITTLFISHDNMLDGMQRLGEWIAMDRQIMIAGHITATTKSILQHVASVAKQLCVIDDAILLDNHAQHVQWIDSIVHNGWHHTNTQSVTRLWSLTAPTEYILSQKGILLAISEQLEMDALEIDPHVNLRRYGLDSIGVVSLVGLWRANGADVRYEDFYKNPNLLEIMKLLLK